MNFQLGAWRYHLSSFYLGYGLELLTQLKAVSTSKSQPANKFVIFTSGRSGSTLLVDFINSNPKVQCDGEHLKRRVANPIGLLRLFERQSQQDTYGFKLLSYQLLNVQTGIKDKAAFFKRLLQQEGYKLIYLERENRVKQALSIIHGLHSGRWHNKGKRKQTMTFELDPAIFYKFLEELAILEQFEHQIIAPYPHLHLVYERDLQDAAQHVAAMQKVSDYIGVEMTMPQSKLRRVSPPKLDELITNKQALINCLKNTPNERYIAVLENM